MWSKIESGQAGNPDMFNTLSNLTEEEGYNSPYKYFPSSLNAIARPEPEPIFTMKNNRRRGEVNENLARIRRVINRHYLYDEEDDSDLETDTDSELETDTDTDNND